MHTFSGSFKNKYKNGVTRQHFIPEALFNYLLVAEHYCLLRQNRETIFEKKKILLDYLFMLFHKREDEKGRFTFDNICK